jgi:hypothetical protein
MQDELCEIANINYWAYWTGEIGEAQCTNDFMIDKNRLHSWTGHRLVPQLSATLIPANPDLELNIRSMRTLLKCSLAAQLLTASQEFSAVLYKNLDILTDLSTPLSWQTRRDVDAIRDILPIPAM